MARTALQVAQAVAEKLGILVPEVLFGSDEDTAITLRSVMDECAVRILEAHDWQKLKTLQVTTGDGIIERFNLPSDYLRMPKDGQVWSTRWQRPMWHITSEDLLRLDIREFDLTVGTWLLLGDQMAFNPVLAANEQARWYYITENIVLQENGDLTDRFMADTDTFRLNDRVLELMTLAEYEVRKGLPFEKDLIEAEKALSRAIDRDKGARIVTQSSRRQVQGRLAYPWQLGGGGSANVPTSGPSNVIFGIDSVVNGADNVVNGS